MNLRELIALSDIWAPSAYADMHKTDWGVMFFDDNNPTKHDINHACIIDDGAFENALSEICDFYLSKKMEPRIYLIKDQKDKYSAILAENGFEVYSVGEFEYYLLTEENKIPHTQNLDIRELKNPDEATEKLLHNLYDIYMDEDPDTVNRMQRMLPRCIQSPHCKVWTGYYKNDPACLAMTVESLYGMMFFDLVETASKYRNRGFARELISYLVDRCDRPTYLYSENPTAISIYEQAGFRKIEVDKNPVYWRAVYKMPAEAKENSYE